MKIKTPRRIIILLILVVISITAFMRKYNATEEGITETKEAFIRQNLANTNLTEKSIIIGKEVLYVEIAETLQEKIIGLSHRRELPKNRGMLFIYKEEGNHGMWMKDMYFSIDIIWIDKNYRVVHIEKNVTPESYPRSFFSPSPAQFVLEVPAGYTNNRITAGDFLKI